MNVLILNAHPQPGPSLSAEIAAAYASGAASASTETIALGSLEFDPILRAGYGVEQPLEPDLERVRLAIERAHHIVLIFPVWWGSLPALLKGLIDRLFLPDWAYRYVEGQALPTPLLTGRTARIISTMDSPKWWYRLKHRRSAHTALRAATLDFVGIKTLGESTLYKTRERLGVDRERWLSKIRAEAARDTARLGRRAPQPSPQAP